MPGAGINGRLQAVTPRAAWQAYRLRWKRRELIWRALRARHLLQPVADRTAAIRPADILAVTTLRNEIAHLPGFWTIIAAWASRIS